MQPSLFLWDVILGSSCQPYFKWRKCWVGLHFLAKNTYLYLCYLENLNLNKSRQHWWGGRRSFAAYFLLHWRRKESQIPSRYSDAHPSVPIQCAHSIDKLNSQSSTQVSPLLAASAALEVITVATEEPWFRAPYLQMKRLNSVSKGVTIAFLTQSAHFRCPLPIHSQKRGSLQLYVIPNM